MDTLYTVKFREVSGLSSFKNFKNQTTGCGDIAYSPVGYFILSHPVYAYRPYVSSADGSGQLELTECDGMNDWRLICPNNCRSVDDSMRQFIASPARDLIAVWGDHDTVWTGEGPDGLELLVMIHIVFQNLF